MATFKLYRSLVIAAVASAALLTAACGSQEAKPTMKKEMSAKWYTAQVKIQLQLAQQQYAVGDYTKCRQTLDGALGVAAVNGIFEGGLESLYGKLDIEKGSLETAAEHLKTACQMDPLNPENFYLLGVVYQRWQKMDVAADYYQQAWDKKTTEARYMLAVVEMKITLGQLDDAEQTLMDKMVLFEQTAAVRVALARIDSLKGDYASSVKHYREAFVLVPDDENLKRSYAEALFFAGKYAEAANQLEEIRHAQAKVGTPAGEEPTDHSPTALMLAQCYLALHRTVDARACYQEVLRSHPDSMPAVLGLGKVCVETNELPAALAAGKRVLRSEPESTQAMILVAVVQQKQKKWSEALATLQGAIGIAPKDSTILCMAGVSQLKLGNPDEATHFFKRAVAANPADTWAVELLAHSINTTPVTVGTAPTPVGATDSTDTLTTAQPAHGATPDAP